MNDLKPETRALLAAARGADALAPQRRDRIKRGVLTQVAVLGASAAVGGGAAAMSVATKITLVLSSLAVLGGGTISVALWQHRRATVEVSHPTTSAPRPARVEPPTKPAAQVTVSPAAPPTPVRREAPRYAPRRPSAGNEPAAPTAPVGPLDPELRVLRQAQDDLRAGLPAQALRRLQDFERRFGTGSLGQERQAIAAIALCQARPGPGAQARAEAFLRSAPDSPLAARVRWACDEAPARDEPSNENAHPREP